MYIKLVDGQPRAYSIGQLRLDNPQVSFPQEIPEDTLAEYDVYFATEQAKPSYNPQTHYLKQSAFYQVNDAWLVQYTAEPLPVEDVAQSVRADRDQRLAATDWTQGKDISDEVSTKWVAYRQALRDVPTQAGFPWDVQWPIQP
jgi:hypothetical protein